MSEEPTQRLYIVAMMYAMVPIGTMPLAIGATMTETGETAAPIVEIDYDARTYRRDGGSWVPWPTRVVDPVDLTWRIAPEDGGT